MPRVRYSSYIVTNSRTGEKINIDDISHKLFAEPVKHEKTGVGDYRCPCCNAAFIDGVGTTPYCGNCGQKIDWNGT